MLQELSIRNFAIIDDLNIRFEQGLTILSGETGAGKSIIINAVNLLLGSRASSKLIRTGEEQAELEALFAVFPDSRVAKLMRGKGYDPAEGLLIRRIISNSERHRIYINGRLATMQVLSAITENLASISGQHAHQGLLKEDQHLMILDQFGTLLSLRAEVGASYGNIVPLIRKLSRLEAMKRHQAEQIDLLRFQEKEILDAAILADENRNLEKEKSRLKNAENLYQTVFESIDILYSAPGSVTERMGEIKKSIERIIGIDPDVAPMGERLGDLLFKIEDLSEDLRGYLSGLEMDEGRLEAIEERLTMLNRLKRKYGGSLEAVSAHLDRIREELTAIENVDDRIIKVKQALHKLHAKLEDCARRLSAERKKSARRLSKKVETELGSLKMSQTRFEISLNSIDGGEADSPYLTCDQGILTSTGCDRAVFMIAPNVGEALKPLTAIASGGELSRVVLALKALLARTETVQTVVFDEVDAGIGGSVAEVVGQKLAALAELHQVICITHLPQIAKFGHHHFKIEKSIEDGRTRTSIRCLNQKERIEEIARMLGGVKITRATLAHAREMLES
jgi:DNA repair protein RecN (Recombination protein N)